MRQVGGFRSFHALGEITAERQSRGHHEGLLRSTDHHVESPAVDIERHGADAGDGIHHDDCVGFGDGAAHRFHVVLHAGGGFRCLYEDAARGGFGLQGRLHTRRRNRVAVLGFQNRGVQAVSFGDVHPTLAEFAGGADDHLVAAAEEVRDRGVHGAGAGCRKHQDVVSSAQDLLQVRQDRPVDLAEILRAVVDV